VRAKSQCKANLCRCLQRDINLAIARESHSAMHSSQISLPQTLLPFPKPGFAVVVRWKSFSGAFSVHHEWYACNSMADEVRRRLLVKPYYLLCVQIMYVHTCGFRLRRSQHQLESCALSSYVGSTRGADRRQLATSNSGQLTARWVRARPAIRAAVRDYSRNEVPKPSTAAKSGPNQTTMPIANRGACDDPITATNSPTPPGLTLQRHAVYLTR
jgi:hypothetical protein